MVDYWIALESLLAPDTGSEISYRASLRGAKFAPITPGFLGTFEILRKSYSARSNFVHGVPTEVVPSLVQQTESCLRAVLTRCIDDGAVPKREELDSLVLTGK